MKDILHQLLFLLTAMIVVTLLRLLLGPWITFLGQTSITLYIVLLVLISIITLIVFIFTKKQ